MSNSHCLQHTVFASICPTQSGYCGGSWCLTMSSQSVMTSEEICHQPCSASESLKSVRPLLKSAAARFSPSPHSSPATSQVCCSRCRRSSPTARTRSAAAWRSNLWRSWCRAARGQPGCSAQALGAELTSLLTAPDVFLRCQAIRVGVAQIPPARTPFPLTHSMHAAWSVITHSQGQLRVILAPVRLVGLLIDIAGSCLSWSSVDGRSSASVECAMQRVV